MPLSSQANNYYIMLLEKLIFVILEFGGLMVRRDRFDI